MGFGRRVVADARCDGCQPEEIIWAAAAAMNLDIPAFLQRN